MGFLDKVKNLFTDEEIIEETKIIEEEQKEERKLPTFMREKIEKQEQEKKVVPEVKVEEVKDDISDRNLVRQSPNFKFPVAFEDTEINMKANTPSPSRNVIAREKNNFSPKVAYNPKTEVKPKKFSPSPIISPVYGILDKNYKKDEPKEKEESHYVIPRDNKKLTYEDIHKKAYGSLADDLKDSILCDDCEILKTVEEIKREHAELKENILSELYDDRDLTLENAEENYYDFGVSYEAPIHGKREPELTRVSATKIEISDISNKDDTSKLKIVSYDEVETTAEKVDIREPQEISKKDKELELTDDLFNLIDSMYEERND